MGPQEKVERRLAAILAADVAGYSRLMSQDEVGTLRTLTAYRHTVDSLIAQHRGRIANTAGDSVLSEFPSAVDAVQCAVEVQEALQRANDALAPERRLAFRIGVHVGDVMVADDGTEVGFRGEYLEIEPDERIVTTEIYEGLPEGVTEEQGATVNTATFTEVDGRTTLAILVQATSKISRDAIIDSGMEDGLHDALDLMEQVARSLA